MPFLLAFLTPSAWLPTLFRFVTSPVGMVVVAFIAGFSYGEIRAHRGFNQRELEQKLHDAQRDAKAKDIAIAEQEGLLKQITQLRAKDKEKIDAFTKLLEADRSCRLSPSDVQRLRDIGQ